MERLMKVIPFVHKFEEIPREQHLNLLDASALTDGNDYRSALYLTNDEWVRCILEYVISMLLGYGVIDIPILSMFDLIKKSELIDKLFEKIWCDEVMKYCTIENDIISLKFTWDNVQQAQIVAGCVFTELGFEIPADSEGWIRLSDEAKATIEANGIEAVAEALAIEFISGIEGPDSTQ